MTYRIIYNETPVLRENVERWRGPAWSEEFADEHQALGRARELIEAGEHHSVAVDDGTGNVLSGVRLQWRLGGFFGRLDRKLAIPRSPGMMTLGHTNLTVAGRFEFGAAGRSPPCR